MNRLPLASVACALVVAPHPDDEAIGAWGVIRTLRRRGVRVRVVVAADGAASHPGSLRWPRARLVAERRRETRRVLRAVGVGAGAVAFLDLPDGGVSALPARGRMPIVRAIVRARADLILLPAADDDHADHRAVAAAARLAITPGARRFAYPVWPARAASGPVARVALGAALPAKRAAIRRYRTQGGAIVDDPGGFAITPAQLRAFSRPAECFARLPR